MAEKMKTVEIDLEIHRLIEANRTSFDEPRLTILRRLLGLSSIPTEEQKQGPSGLNLSDGVFLPDGTRFKRIYKGKEYQAEVRGGQIALDGKKYKSPSGAAMAITGSPVNGWRFWQVKKPEDSEWRLLDQIRE